MEIVGYEIYETRIHLDCHVECQGINDLIQHDKISILEQQVKSLQKVDISKFKQNKNFIQFCQENKLIFVVGEGQQREIFKTNILCK